MISVTSPTRSSYSIQIEQGRVSSGALTFAARSIAIVPQGGEIATIVPQNGVSLSLAMTSRTGSQVDITESTSIDGAIQNQPKESN